MVAENEYVFLRDESGKRYSFRVSYGMLKIPSLGAIDGSRFKDMEEGDSVSILGKQMVLLRPNTTDLMETLDRGAQIITPKDASTILLYCGVRPGSRVLEVGAGSGGLTTALLCAVGPEGRVHTVEIREDYAQRTAKNISRTGLDRCWGYTIGDAREVKPDIDWKADVLTMDMPDPELALDNIGAFLRPGGMVAAYVPNMNQMEAAVKALRERGYIDVKALENIQRYMEVHPGGVRPSYDTLGHTAYLVFARKVSGPIRGARRCHRNLVSDNNRVRVFRCHYISARFPAHYQH